MAIMGLDVGTTGCKSSVYSNSGKKLSESYHAYSAKREKDAHTIDAAELLSCVKSAILEAAVKCGEEVDAIGVSTFGEAFVPVDRTGKPLYEVMLYTDNRGAAECQKLCDKLGEEAIIAVTGAKPNKMYSLPKMMWLKEHCEEIYKDCHKLLLMEDFVIFNLTGNAVIDYSLAARTLAFDIEKKCWSKTLLQAAEIEENKLSSCVPSGTAAGTIKPSLTTELHLGKNCIAVTGGHDQVCAATGAGVLHSGMSVDGTGTVECITPLFDKPIKDAAMQNMGYACVPYTLKDKYVTYAFNYTGGALLKWFCDSFIKQDQTLRGNLYQVMDGKVKSHPSDLLILPHFAGAATPYMDDFATGAILGLNLSHTREDIYQAIMEGVTFEILLNMEKLQPFGVNIRELVAVGGGAKSNRWLQMKADITGLPVVSLIDSEAGITGTVMLCSNALKITDNLEQAASLYVHKGQRFEPDFKLTERYREQFEKYKKMYDAVKTILR